MMNAIEVKNLFYSYKNNGTHTPILKDLNLAIKQGEFVAIQGPSGSGKSTLLYILGLLSTPMSGEIKVLGKNISDLNEEELAHNRNKNIGFIFQHFHLLPKTRALDNILLPIHYSEQRAAHESFVAKAKEYAELVGLGNHLHHMPNQLSGGQQQRVAICRALMNDPDIILADEPTGNLDSDSSKQILELLRKLNRDLKKTVVIITHDNDVAQECDRIIRIKDGRVLEEHSSPPISPPKPTHTKKHPVKETNIKELLYTIKASLPSALINLGRNKTRTALTMIGISVGISAVFAMITLGQFTKVKILSGYADLGVNTIKFYGRPNWDMKATDVSPSPFQFFNWDKDLVSLGKVFPEIEKLSPMLNSWDGQVNYGGRTIDQDIRIMGVSEDGLLMLRRNLLVGRNFSAIEITQKSGVCIIGHEIAETLFTTTWPIGKILKIAQGENSYGCRIIGVLHPTTSNKEQVKPNLQVFLPFTYYQASAGDWWSSQIHQVMFQININSDVEKVGKGIKAFYKQRYGNSGRFQVDSDTILIAQMRRFLSLFTILLSSIAFVTLAVGGIGITNMMLISVSERFREIGLRKALGATNREIRVQFLVESMIVCGMAGLIGLLLGFIGYHTAIWAATKFVDKLKFEWIIDWFALLLSICSIIFVGILSGIFPALKAQKLQVIESLRSE